MTSTVYLIVAICLGLGGVAILALGGFTTQRQGARTGLHGIVCLIAATLYMVLATGGTTVDVGPVTIDTHHFVWLLATPLLIAALTVTASPIGRPIVPLALTVIFVDVVMVLAGAVVVEQTGAAVWVWFLVSLIALGFVYLLLWEPIREIAHSGHPTRAELYDRHAGLLTILWSLWPVAFFLGPDFQGLWGAGGQALVYGAIDIAAMVAYGLLVVLEDERLIPLEEGEERAFPAARAQLTAAMYGSPAPEPPLVAVPRAGRAAARQRLLDLYYRGGEAARLAAGAGRHHAGRMVTAGRPLLMRTTTTVRHAPPPPPPPRRRPRPRPPGLLDTPFGRLRREDMVPAAMVAAALLVIAHTAHRAGRDRRP